MKRMMRSSGSRIHKALLPILPPPPSLIPSPPTLPRQDNQLPSPDTVLIPMVPLPPMNGHRASVEPCPPPAPSPRLPSQQGPTPYRSASRMTMVHGQLPVTSSVTVTSPSNTPPTAFIDSITPNPATTGQSVTFTGHGVDTDGTVTAYEWTSSISGALSTATTFSTSSLSAGTHTISLRVQDDDGAWSTPGHQQCDGNFSFQYFPPPPSLTPLPPTLPRQDNQLPSPDTV